MASLKINDFEIVIVQLFCDVLMHHECGFLVQFALEWYYGSKNRFIKQKKSLLLAFSN